MKIGNNKFWLTVLGSILLVVISLFTVSCLNRTGTVSELAIAKGIDENGQPVDPTNVYTTDTKELYLSFKISGFPVGTKIEVDWIYVGGDPDVEFVLGKNYVTEKQMATVTKTGAGYTSTMYSPIKMGFEEWPKGEYKVVVYVEGVEKASTTFKME